MAEEKQEFTNEGGELVTLYDGTPVFPGRTVRLTEQQVKDNPGLFEGDESALTQGGGAEQQEAPAPKRSTTKGEPSA